MNSTAVKALTKVIAQKPDLKNLKKSEFVIVLSGGKFFFVYLSICFFKKIFYDILRLVRCNINYFELFYIPTFYNCCFIFYEKIYDLKNLFIIILFLIIFENRFKNLLLILLIM